MGPFHVDLRLPAARSAAQRRVGVFRIISFSVGLTVGLMSAVGAPSSADGQKRDLPPQELNRPLGEFHVTPRLDDEIMRRADPFAPRTGTVPKE